MALVAVPSALKALVQRLATFSEITALVSTASGWQSGGSGNRISGALQDKWAMPTHAIWLNEVPGAGPPDESAGIMVQLYDIHYYGPTLYEARRLWSLVVPALCPLPPGPRAFISGGCRVYDVAQVGGLGAVIAPETNWPEVVSSVRVRYSMVPAP